MDAGRVTALKKGSAVVTATSDSKSDSCTVTVTPAVYRIETAHTDSGDIPAWDTLSRQVRVLYAADCQESGPAAPLAGIPCQGLCVSTSAPTPANTVDWPGGDKFTGHCPCYNEVVLDGSRERVRITSSISPSNNFYPPSVQPLLGRGKRLHRHRPGQRLLWRRHHPSSSPAPSCCRRPEPHTEHIS